MNEHSCETDLSSPVLFKVTGKVLIKCHCSNGWDRVLNIQSLTKETNDQKGFILHMVEQPHNIELQ